PRMKKGRKLLESLGREFTDAADKQKRIGLAVGLAYLNFHLWHRLGFSAQWRPQAETLPRPASEEGNRLIREALAFASQAYRASKDVDMQKHVYALNQYLY